MLGAAFSDVCCHSAADSGMATDDEFHELIRRIRAGDDAAAQEIVARFEPLVRRELRLHMHNVRLRRVVDSVDVCQSVLASFFQRAVAGQYDLDKPEQLAALLSKMARNKLASAVRWQQQQRRDDRRTAADSDAARSLAVDPADNPLSIVIARELQQRMQTEFTKEERQIAEFRGEGLSWQDIAAKLGGTPNSRRMQLSRALERVAKILGTDEA